MAFDANTALQAIRNANSKWLGYRYIVLSVPNTVFSNIGISQAGIAAAGISEIEFPTITVAQRRIPSLSTIDRHIPRHVSYSDLVLRAPTIRQTALYDRIQFSIQALKKPDFYVDVPESVIIGEFEASNTFDLLPIAIWSVRGAQAKSFKPASANAQGAAMPMEELRFQVDSLVRASGA